MFNPEPLNAAGFSIGGDSLAITQGVASRLEVLEYSHSGRALLALQVGGKYRYHLKDKVSDEAMPLLIPA